MKIRTRLAVTFVPLAVIALIVLAGTNYLQARSALVGHQVSHLRSVASVQERRIHGVVKQNLERLALVSSRTQLRLSLVRYLEQPNPAPARKMTRILLDAQASIPEFRAIHVLTLAGDIVASTDSSVLNTNRRATESFQRGLTRNVADLPMLNEDGILTFVLAGPLVVDGKRVGVVVVRTSGGTILAAVGDYAGLGVSGETVLARRTVAGGAQYIVPLRFDGDAALRRTVSAASGAPIVRAVNEREEFVVESVDYRGVAVVTVGRNIEGVGWGLLVKIDKREAFATIDRMLLVVLGILAALVLGVVGLTFVVAGPIAGPIARLTTKARAISGGGGLPQPGRWRGGEVGELAASFDEMARRVAHRTEDLEQANDRLRLEIQEHRRTTEALESSQGELSDTVHELKQRNAELERFAFTVSHDLKSPIVTIQGFAGLLKKDLVAGKPERVADDLQRIGSAADHMKRLLDDVLALSRAGRVRRELESCSVRELVDGALMVLGSDAGDASTVFTFDTELGAIACDPLRMGDALQNLLGNAIKFSAKRETPRVHVGVRRDGDRRVFYVRDNGCGVDKSHYETIFELFERLDAGVEGTGIGLALVQRIITAHDGRVWVEPNPEGEGSTFCFWLPEVPSGERPSQ